MKTKRTLFELSLSALFAAVTVICAWISVPAPVPFTLQTLAVFVACAFLGAKGALLSTAVYILLGAVGLPVFAGFRGGFSAFVEPSGGFVWGFILIPVAYGSLCRLFGKKLRALWLFVGLLLCYLTGSLWYLFYTDERSYPLVLLTTVVPFVIPDAVKLFVALTLADALKKGTERSGLLHRDRPSPAAIKKALGGRVEVFTFDEIDSTNSEAARRMRRGAGLPALFVAEKQTAGRGRRGRSFFSEGGLYMSLALDLKQTDSVGLTTLVSVAVAEAIEELTGEKTGIKWVNDLFLKDKKICGILCECVCCPETGEKLGTVIGVGVNLNVKSFPEELREIAGSLSSKTATKTLLAAKITQNILNELENKTDHITRYKERSVVLGKTVRFEENGTVFEGVAEDITESGALVVVTAQDKKTLTSGEITLRIKR